MENSPTDSPIDRYVVLEYLAEGGMGAIYLGKKMGAGGFEKQGGAQAAPARVHAPA